MKEKRPYQSFDEFYPFYLSEHSHPLNRFLHFMGTSLSLGILISAFLTATYWLIGVALIQGYAWAWIGHFLIEKNRPATFTYPLYSFLGDWKMWFEILVMRRGLKDS